MDMDAEGRGAGMNIKRILVGLCLIETSQALFNHAARLAECLGADIVAVNIINIRGIEAIASVESMGYSISSEAFVESVREERLGQFKTIVAASGFPGEKVKVVVKVGHPYDELLKQIREQKADMVVIGTKGRSNLPDVLVGSVAEKIFRHSPVTVAALRLTG